MRVLDAQEQLVWDSEVSVAVLGMGQDFVLISLKDGELDATKLAEAHCQSYVYVGVLSVNKDGQLCAECGSAPDAAHTILHAALEFAQQVAGRLRPKDDFTAWCERLHDLQDPRNG